MHNSISKKLLAGALSVMMVLSLVAPTGAQAASKYSLTQKSGLSTVKADKAYTYNVKGVKKTQYIKVTKTYKDVVVKKGGTTVKKATKIKGTGKTIALKVTCPDKVATYKNTLKVKVYNKKNNKLVKTLSKKATVKVTKFAIKEVVSTTAAAESGYKYIRATFTKALKGLDASEVEISNKATGQIYSVEKVALATNGKSADVTLVGNVAAAGTSFLQANTDYIFKVTQAGAEANIEFYIEAVAADVIVDHVDAAKKTISVGSATFTVPSKITVDYEDVLGRTVSIWYDKNFEISKLVKADEKVEYGCAYVLPNAKTGVTSVINYTTGKEYAIQDTTVGTNVASSIIAKGAKNTTSRVALRTTSAKAAYDYAKYTFNPNGTVRTIVAVRSLDHFLVDEIKETTVSAGSVSELNLKNYTIVKDGKTVEASAIVAGDVVDYNSTDLFAIVNTNKKSGKLEAVYDLAFKFDGEKYTYAVAPSEDDINVFYIKAKKGFVSIDNDYMNSLLASGKDVTVHFDNWGDPIYVTGETAESKTSDVTLVLNKVDAKSYQQSLAHFVRFKGFDGKEEKTYDVNVADLQFVDAVKVDGKTVFGFALSDTTDHANIETCTTSAAAASMTPSGTAVITNIKTTCKQYEVVTLTLNEAGKVVGIKHLVEQGNNNTIRNIDGEAITASGSDPAIMSKNFKAGYKTLDGLQVTASTPMYIIAKTTNNATATTYGAFTGSTNVDGDVRVYADENGKNVALIVAKNLDEDDSNSVTREAVVSTSAFGSTGTKPIVSLTVVDGANGEKTYESFAETAIASARTLKDAKNLESGCIVTIKLNKDESKVLDITNVEPATAEAVVAKANTTTKVLTIGEGTFNLSTTVVPTIVKLNSTGTAVSAIDFNTLAENVEDYKINYSLLAGSAGIIDTIVVTTDKVAEASEPETTKGTISYTEAGTTSYVSKKLAQDTGKVLANYVPEDKETVESIAWYVNNVKSTCDKAVWNQASDVDPRTGVTAVKGTKLVCKMTLSTGKVVSGEEIEIQERVATTIKTVDTSTAVKSGKKTGAFSFLDQFKEDKTVTNMSTDDWKADKNLTKTAGTGEEKVKLAGDATGNTMTLTVTGDAAANDEFTTTFMGVTIKAKCTTGGALGVAEWTITVVQPAA